MKTRLEGMCMRWEDVSTHGPVIFNEGVTWVLESLETLANKGDHGPAKLRTRLGLVRELKEFIYQEIKDKV